MTGMAERTVPSREDSGSTWVSWVADDIWEEAGNLGGMTSSRVLPSPSTTLVMKYGVV